MQFSARTFLILVAVMSGISAVRAQDRAIVVLDASGSMWGQIDGRPKLEIARDTLRAVLQTMPDDLEFGLKAYGHRQKDSCQDIELVMPLAKCTATAIAAAADQMKFLGKTPLSAAVKKAAEDLNYTQEKATVILITDGLESCSADPCALGAELERSGVDFTAHVVGFGLTADEGRQVACLAENTGGKYVQASDAGHLADALKTTVAETAPTAPEPQPAPTLEPAKVEFTIMPTASLDDGGEQLDSADLSYRVSRAGPDGSAGDYVTTQYGLWKGGLGPGDYVIVAKMGEASTKQKVKVEEGKTAKPHFVLDAGVLAVDAPGASEIRLFEGKKDLQDERQGVTYAYGETMRSTVPAGDYLVIVTPKGEGAKKEQPVTVKAGGHFEIRIEQVRQ